MTTTIIKKLVVRGRHFTICRNQDGWYLAIEDKYITNGRINQTLNGFQMHAHEELARCIKTTQDAVETDYLVEQGHSRAEAFCMVNNMMDNLDMVKELFKEA